MSNVVPLGKTLPPIHRRDVNEALVQALEKVLEAAKSGDLQSFIGTGFQTDGCRMSVWAGHHDNVYEMLGAINWLEHEYVHRVTTDD